MIDEALVAELERDEEDRRQKEEDILRRKDLRDAKKVAKLEAGKVKVAEQSRDSSCTESVEEVAKSYPLYHQFKQIIEII